MNLKHLLQHRTINLMDYIVYQILKIILQYFKKHETTDNPPVRIYINKIENNIIFKIKTGYYLELVMSGTMNYLQTLKKG